MPQFSELFQTPRELTANGFDVVEAHLRGRARHLDVVIKVRSSMERCPHDSKVVRRRRRLFMGKGALKTSMSPAERNHT